MSEERPAEIKDAKPTSVSHIVGQQSVVEQATVALDAAFADGTPMPHALLLGPPGLGKTCTAHVIANEMAGECHEVLGQSIRSPADLNALLLAAKHRDVVHVDEAHELDRTYQTALYLALDQKRVLLNGDKKDGVPAGIPLAEFTLLLSTTDEYRLLQPLRDRMRLVLRFHFYSEDELTELLRQKCRMLEWDVASEVLPQIAERSRGTPRLGLRLLESSRRVCRANGEEFITSEHLRRACALEGIDELGLGPSEQQYLSVLLEGPQRLNVVASRLGLPTRTVSAVTEPFLIRAGLVAKDGQSRRQLTARGREHALQKHQPEEMPA